MKKIITSLFVACVIIPINAGTWMTLSQIDNALGHTSSSNTELGMYGTDVLKDGAASYTFTKMRVNFFSAGTVPVGLCEIRYRDTDATAVKFGMYWTSTCYINGKNSGYFTDHGTVINASEDLYEFDLNKVCSTSGKTFYIKRFGHTFRTGQVELYVTIKYSITVESNNTSYGTVSGGGTYEKGTSVTIKATPKTGYKFTQWQDGNTNASRTITVNANATYTATFAPITYTITWKNDDGSTIDQTSVEYGEMPTHADPTKTSDAAETDYVFAGWTPEVTAVTGNATYTATFIPVKATKDVQIKAEHGKVRIIAAYPEESRVTMQAEGEAAATLEGWSDNSAELPRTVTPAEGDSITATFERLEYTITTKE